MTLTQIKPAGLSKPVDLADNEKIRLGTGNDLQIYHDGTRSWLANATGGLRLSVAGGSNRVDINKGTVDEHMARFQADGAVELFYDNSKKFETYSNGCTVTGNLNVSSNVDLSDTARARFGTGNDLQIYHDGSNSVLSNSTGYLVISTGATESIYLQGQRVMGQPSGGGDIYFVGNKDGAFEAYYDNSKKFETISSGVQISGTLFIPDGSQSTNRISVGNGGDLQIYHDGNSKILNGNNSCDLRIISNAIELKSQSGDEFFQKCTVDGAVEIYHDNSKKLITTTTGIDINTGGSEVGSSIKIYGHDVLKRARWGYSAAYKGVLVGRTDYNTNSSIFMGVDPSGNTSGAFGGYGQEIIFRNDLAFYHPNNANNNWKTFMRTGQFADTGAVQFPNGLGFGSDTATANILDDYEEGTWTPGGSWSTIVGTYTKIGRVVHAACQVRVNTSGSANMALSNLPFACANDEASRNGVFWGWNEWDSTVYGQLTGNIVPGGSTLNLYRMDGSGSAVTYSQLGNNKYLKLVVCYQTA